MGIILLVVVIMVVLNYWGTYRSSKDSTAAPVETTTSVEGTASADSTASPEGGEGDAAPAADAEPSQGTVVVLIDGLNFRTGASKSSDLIAGLDKDTKLAYLEHGGRLVQGADFRWQDGLRVVFGPVHRATEVGDVVGQMIGAAAEFYRLRITRIDVTDEPELDWHDDILYRDPPVEVTEEEEDWRLEAVHLEDESVHEIAQFTEEDQARVLMLAIQDDLDRDDQVRVRGSLSDDGGPAVHRRCPGSTVG